VFPQPSLTVRRTVRRAFGGFPMPDGDQGRWLSYQELGELLSCTPNAARMHAVRRKWQRRAPNRIGDCARVLVPEDLDMQPRAMHVRRTRGAPFDAPPNSQEKIVRPAQFDARAVHFSTFDAHHMQALAGAVGALQEQLDIANQRADRAEQRADEAQAAERKAIDLVKNATAEASDQRKRADDAATAERIARDEAAGLRAELEIRREWGLRRRLRWALGRRR
jgi:hypothetical protein